MKFLLLFFLCITQVSAKEYNVVVIQNSYTQEIGVIVIRQIYKKLGIEITIKKLSAGRAESDVKNGYSDGEAMRINSYGKSNPSVIRVPTSYYESNTVAYVLANTDINITNVDDLKEYSVAKVRGIKHAENVTKHVNDVHDSNSSAHILQQLSAGLVDVAITSELDGKIFASSLHLTNVKAIETPLNTHKLYHYLHIKHAQLVPKIDQIIKDMRTSGELHKLIKDAEKTIVARVTSNNN